MNINLKKTLPQTWYEDGRGGVWIPPKQINGGTYLPPISYNFMHTRFTNVVDHKTYALDGETKEPINLLQITEFDFSERLVEKMVRSGWSLSQSMAICSTACKQCQAEIANHFNVPWGDGGYISGNQKDNTSCSLCDGS